MSRADELFEAFTQDSARSRDGLLEKFAKHQSSRGSIDKVDWTDLAALLAEKYGNAPPLDDEGRKDLGRRLRRRYASHVEELAFPEVVRAREEAEGQ